MDLLREAEDVADGQDRAVVQDRLAGHAAEDLMLIGDEDLEIDLGRPVQDGHEIHLEPAVGGGKAPGLHVAVFRDMEGHVVQLVDLSVVEEHVLRGGGGVAETVADVEAEGHTVKVRIAAAPVPGIVVGPDAPAPVQGAEIRLGIKGIADAVVCHPARGPHAVDLLIIIKMLVLGPGGGDDHGLHIGLGEDDVAVEGLVLPEPLEVAGDAPLPRPRRKAHLEPFILVDGLAAAGIARQLQLAQGEGVEDRLRVLPRLFAQTQQGHGLQADIPVVGDGESTREVPAHDQVVVPLLDTPGRGLDPAAVVFLYQVPGPAGLGQVPPPVQQVSGRRHFVITHGCLLFFSTRS